MPPTNSFEPTPPPGSVSPSSAPRKRASGNKAAKKPAVPKNLHLVTDAEIKAGAAKKRKKAAKKKAAKKTGRETGELVKIGVKELAKLKYGEAAPLFLKLRKLLTAALPSHRVIAMRALKEAFE